MQSEPAETRKHACAPLEHICMREIKTTRSWQSPRGHGVVDDCVLGCHVGLNPPLYSVFPIRDRSHLLLLLSFWVQRHGDNNSVILDLKAQKGEEVGALSLYACSSKTSWNDDFLRCRPSCCHEVWRFIWGGNFNRCHPPSSTPPGFHLLEVLTHC